MEAWTGLMMTSYPVIASTPAHVIVTKAASSLRVLGWNTPKITVSGDDTEAHFDATTQTLSVKSRSECTIRLPEQATLEIRMAQGNLRITDCLSTITIVDALSDVTVRNGGTFALDQAGGSVRVKHMQGEVRVGQVQGSLSVRDVHADVHVELVTDDLTLEGIEGQCHIGEVHGDLVIADVFHGEDHHMGVVSDAICRVTASTDVQFVLPADTEMLISVPGAQTTQDEEGHCCVTVGEPTTRIYVECEGDFRLGIQGETSLDDLLKIDSTDEHEIRVQMNLDVDLSDLQQQIARQAELLREKVVQRSEKQVRSLQEQFGKSFYKRVTQEINAAVIPSSAMPPPVPVPPPAPLPPAPPAVTSSPSKRERLMILRMLESRRISVEEANQLLAALGGDED